MKLRVGTSGYAYPEWKGAFYPADLPAARMLAYYAAQFATVEINATFYRMPNARTLQGWAATVSEDFVFALKAPQRITHLARLAHVDEPLRHFCDTVRALGANLGPLLFQLPPSFRRDTGRLADLLARLPEDLAVAFEFRHPSWFDEDVYRLLRARRAALAIVDIEAGTTPAVATAGWGYLRLRDVDYDDAGLRRWLDTIVTVGAGWREAFVYFKHEAAAAGPALARRLAALAGAGAPSARAPRPGRARRPAPAPSGRRRPPRAPGPSGS